MITTILFVAMSQGAGGQTNDREAMFLRALSESSKPSMSVATLMKSADAAVVGQVKLNAEARGFSEEWMNKVLSAPMRKAAAKINWTGRKSADGVSKLYQRTWSSDLGMTTWSDNGAVAVLHVRLNSPTVLLTKEEAQSFAATRLSQVLTLPKVTNAATKWYLEPGSSSGSAKLFSGNVFRGVRTEPMQMPNGDMGEKVLDPFKWHNALFVASDGADLVIRINFFDSDRETVMKVADSRTRF